MEWQLNVGAIGDLIKQNQQTTSILQRLRAQIPPTKVAPHPLKGNSSNTLALSPTDFSSTNNLAQPTNVEPAPTNSSSIGCNSSFIAWNHDFCKKLIVPKDYYRPRVSWYRWRNRRPDCRTLYFSKADSRTNDLTREPVKVVTIPSIFPPNQKTFADKAFRRFLRKNPKIHVVCLGTDKRGNNFYQPQRREGDPTWFHTFRPRRLAPNVETVVKS